MTFKSNHLSLCYQEEILSKFYLFQCWDYCEWYQLNTILKKGMFSRGIQERIYKINVPAIHVLMFTQNTLI